MSKNGLTKAEFIVLKIGIQGPQVAELQNCLKMTNFDCGTSDGIFGPMTEAAVKKLQTTNSILDITGIYDEKTHNYLMKLVKHLV